MVERVESGGLRGFSYGRNYNPKLDEAKKSDIKKGYEEYYERRRKERRNKILFLIVIVLFAVIGAGYLIFK